MRVVFHVSNDPTYTATAGDIHIENTRAPVGVYVIDPQHGSHRPHPAWPTVEADDAACTFAYRLAKVLLNTYRDEDLHVVLTPVAGIDDYAAAAVLLLGAQRGDKLLTSGIGGRLMAIADLDNAGQTQAMAWQRGYLAVQVDDSFPGVGRLTKLPGAPIEWKVEKVAEWLTTGQILMASLDDQHFFAGLGAVGEDIYPALDLLATARRDEYVSRCLVDQSSVDLVLVRSPALTGDPSEGQGGFRLGYQHAPFVVAYYPLQGSGAGTTYKYTIGRHRGALRGWHYGDMVYALNDLELQGGGDPKWGGNPASGVVGSPTSCGSVLDPRVVEAVVTRYIGSDQ